MEILKISEPDILERVFAVLREGGVVCVPTDTVYGFVADATNEAAVRAIFEIKGREDGKPFPVFVSGIKMAKEYANISSQQEKFLQAVWPGAVTAVLRIMNNELRITDKVVRDGTIGMRAPKDDFLLKILREIGVPLAQSSANVSGRLPARNAEEVCAYFGERRPSPAFVVDGGERGGEASTVIDLSGKAPRVLREGALPSEEIFRLLGSFGL